MKNFWNIIIKLLWEQIEYFLKFSRQIVFKWIVLRIDKLMKKKMSFETKIEYNDFKIIIKKFIEKVKTIKGKKKREDENY